MACHITSAEIKFDETTQRRLIFVIFSNGANIVEEYSEAGAASFFHKTGVPTPQQPIRGGVAVLPNTRPAHPRPQTHPATPPITPRPTFGGAARIRPKSAAGSHKPAPPLPVLEDEAWLALERQETNNNIIAGFSEAQLFHHYAPRELCCIFTSEQLGSKFSKEKMRVVSNALFEQYRSEGGVGSGVDGKVTVRDIDSWVSQTPFL